MESLPNDPSLFLASITDLLRLTFGNRIEVAEVQTRAAKRDYQVLVIKTQHPSEKVVLKVAGPHTSRACPFEQSAFLHQLIALQTTIPMPQVYAADVSCEKWPWRYLLRAAVSGVEWAEVVGALSSEEVAMLQAQLGEMLAQLHAISFPSFGEFAPNGEVIGDAKWLNAFRRRAQKTIKSPSLSMHFSSLLDRNVDLFVNIDRAVLCHEDLHRHNILLEKQGEQWQIATILDFDKAWAGSAESDLARLEFWDGMISESFWDAYLVRHELSPQYEQRRPLYQLLWCFEYGKTNEKHLAETNRLCSQLGMPPVENFT